MNSVRTLLRPFCIPAVALVLALVVVGASSSGTARAGATACVGGPHHGGIAASQTWCRANNPHIVDGNVTIASGATLTIEGGAVVEFQSGCFLEAYTGSALLAQGSGAYPITFTSASATPAAGSWANIWINAGVQLRMDHVEIAYAGSGWNKGLYVRSSDAQVRNSRIHHTAGDGIYVTSDSVGLVLDTVQADNNVWRGIYLETINSAPSLYNLTLSANGSEGLVFGSASLTRDITLDASDDALNGAPARFEDNILVNANTTLTVTAGSLVKMGWHYRIEVAANGTLVAEGTAEDPIIFTSGTASPAPADWANFWFASGSTARLEHVDISYAGSGWNRCVYLNANDVEVRNSRVHNCAGEGIWMTGNSVGALFDTVQIDHNSGIGIYQETINSDPSLHNITMSDNGTNALHIDYATLTRDVTLDATVEALNGAAARIEDNILVNANTTLTVTAGSLVKMGLHYRIEVAANGTLVAEGTAEDPIIFTSGTASPAPADWANFWFASGSTARLEHVDISYAGSGWNRCVYLNANDVELRNSRVHHCAGDGVYVESASVGALLDTVQSDHNSGWGVSQARIDSNPRYHNLTLTDNTGGALLMISGDVSNRSALLDGSPAALNGAPVVMYDSWVSIYDGKVLTMTAGTVLQLATSGTLEVRAGGTLVAEGTEEMPIAFTALPAAAGSWQRIDVQTGGAAKLSYCDIRYGGRFDYSVLYLRSSGVEVSHCTIHDNLGPAIETVSDAFPLIRYNRIQDNGFGVRNSNPTSYVDARRNYWGDPTGPNHPTTNPGGLGDGVSDRVLYFPWATSPDGTLVATAGVQVIGPDRASPGSLADYYLSYYTYQPLTDVLLAFDVPETAVYQQSDPAGDYLTSASQVYWLLGDLAAGAEGVIKVQAEFLWGLPAGFPDGASAILYSPDLDLAPFSFDPSAYTDYQPIEPGASVLLLPAQITAELNAYAELNTLYQEAVADGYMLLGGSIDTLGGQPYTVLILANGDSQAVRYLRRDRSGSHAEAYTFVRGRYQAANTEGGTVMDYLTAGVTGYGSWTDLARVPAAEEAAQNAAPDAAISAYACFRNCTLKAAGMWALQKVSNTADAVIKTKDCVLALAGDGDAAANCFLALQKVGKTVPGASEIVEAHRCIQDCTWEHNRSKHVCDPSKPIYSVEPAVTSLLNPATWFGGAKAQYVRWTCNPTTLMWQSPETLYCPKGFIAQAGALDSQGRPCVPANEDVAFAYGYPMPASTVATTVRRAHDPNAKLGPSREVLPTEVLSYTITYENEGQGIAYGVFVLDELPETFDQATLVIGDGGKFSAPLRTISWNIGTLQPKGVAGSKGQVTFQVALKAGLPDGTVIQNRAVVYFPSVPEETPTNWVVNVVRSLVAYPQTVDATSGTPKAITLQGADLNGLPLTFEITQAPPYGTLTGSAPNVTYTPYGSYQGADGFWFRVDNGTSQSSPAFVEIVVGPSASDSLPPTVRWHSPEANATVDISGSAPFTDEMGTVYPPMILIEFSEPLAAATVNGSAVILRNAQGQAVPESVAYLEGTTLVSLTPRAALAEGKYSVSLTSGITDLKGNHLGAVSWQFEIGGQEGPDYFVFLPLVRRSSH